MSGQGGNNRQVKVPFASVEDAITRRGEERGLDFYDELVAARPSETAVELAKFVLRSLGVEESVQTITVNGAKVRTRYGNDVQAIAARVREAGKRAGRPSSRASASSGNVDHAQAWAVEVEAMVNRDPAYLAALLKVLERSGHLGR